MTLACVHTPHRNENDSGFAHLCPSFLEDELLFSLFFRNLNHETNADSKGPVQQNQDDSMKF